MEFRIDLDAAAREISRRVDRWRASGLSVGEVTWRDHTEAWPRRFHTHRGDVREPDSIGIRCIATEREVALALLIEL